MKSTNLTANYTYEDFLNKYGDEAVVMCALNPDRSLTINTIDSPLVPKAGQTLIAMVNVTPVPDGHAVRDAGSNQPDKKPTNINSSNASDSEASTNV